MTILQDFDLFLDVFQNFVFPLDRIQYFFVFVDNLLKELAAIPFVISLTILPNYFLRLHRDAQLLANIIKNAVLAIKFLDKLVYLLVELFHPRDELLVFSEFSFTAGQFNSEFDYFFSLGGI